MKIRCVWEHNGEDSLLFGVDFPGTFTRGPSLQEALRKMPGEVASYLQWAKNGLFTPFSDVAEAFAPWQEAGTPQTRGTEAPGTAAASLSQGPENSLFKPFSEVSEAFAAWQEAGTPQTRETEAPGAAASTLSQGPENGLFKPFSEVAEAFSPQQEAGAPQIRAEGTPGGDAALSPHTERGANGFAEPFSAAPEVIVVQEKPSTLRIRDADSDVLFDTERLPLKPEEYRALKALALKSAEDFERMYRTIPDRNVTVLAARETFYGPVPRTAREMYEHTKSVNSYYFAEIGVEAENDGTIRECRERGFALLETAPGFLQNPVFAGSYGEDWSLRKVLRRFIWHDRIHAKAMYRMAKRAFPGQRIEDVFCFDCKPE